MNHRSRNCFRPHLFYPLFGLRTWSYKNAIAIIHSMTALLPPSCILEPLWRNLKVNHLFKMVYSPLQIIFDFFKFQPRTLKRLILSTTKLWSKRSPGDRNQRRVTELQSPQQNPAPYTQITGKYTENQYDIVIWLPNQPVQKNTNLPTAEHKSL